MQSQSIGSVEFGKVFYFSVSNRVTSGGASGWDPLYFDVFDTETGAMILQNQATIRETDIDVWYGSIDTGQGNTDSAVGFAVGTYGIVFKQTQALAPGVFGHLNFTITSSISTRLKRIAGLLGENMVLDNFGFDSAGNCVSYRIRLFESRFAAENASLGITDVPEPGEVATYAVEQGYSSGRMFRTSHVSLIDNDTNEE